MLRIVLEIGRDRKRDAGRLWEKRPGIELSRVGWGVDNRTTVDESINSQPLTGEQRIVGACGIGNSELRNHSLHLRG